MFRTIKIVFNATIIVLALIGFNAIGGQKYVEMAKDAINTFIMSHNMDAAKKIGDFSKMNEEKSLSKEVRSVCIQLHYCHLPKPVTHQRRTATYRSEKRRYSLQDRQSRKKAWQRMRFCFLATDIPHRMLCQLKSPSA